jgi:hypothetical protein
VKNFVIALSIFAFTAPGFAEENSSSKELSARHGGSGGHGGHGGHSHGSSGHHHGGSGHGGHGHHGHGDGRGHYHHGRFDDHYFHSHFGPGNLIIWGGPGFFWFGAPWISPFWFGGVWWGFGVGVAFLPQWQVAGWYVASVATGYVLLNATFPGVQVPVVVNINMAPPAQGDEE